MTPPHRFLNQFLTINVLLRGSWLHVHQFTMYLNREPTVSQIDWEADFCGFGYPSTTSVWYMLINEQQYIIPISSYIPLTFYTCACFDLAKKIPPFVGYSCKCILKTRSEIILKKIFFKLHLVRVPLSLAREVKKLVSFYLRSSKKALSSSFCIRDI